MLSKATLLEFVGIQTASIQDGAPDPIDRTEPTSHGAASASPSTSATAMRTALLDVVRDAVNVVLLQSVEAGGNALYCDTPAVRDLCIAVEVALVFQLLPPLFQLRVNNYIHAWGAAYLLQLRSLKCRLVL